MLRNLINVYVCNYESLIGLFLKMFKNIYIFVICNNDMIIIVFCNNELVFCFNEILIFYNEIFFICIVGDFLCC